VGQSAALLHRQRVLPEPVQVCPIQQLFPLGRQPHALLEQLKVASHAMAQAPQCAESLVMLTSHASLLVALQLAVPAPHWFTVHAADAGCPAPLQV